MLVALLRKNPIAIRGIEQIRQDTMSFFERLKAAASVEWRAYTEHPFTTGMADGTLIEAAFRYYLVQDYLFLIEFCSTRECAAICWRSMWRLPPA